MEELWTSLDGHIGDLRQTLIRSLGVIIIGFLVVLTFYQPLIQLLTPPTLETLDSGLIKKHVEREIVTNPTQHPIPFELPQGAWFVNELERPANNLLAPGQSIAYEKLSGPAFLIMGPIDGIILVFKTCFWFSLALTAPLWGWFLLQFILPGLTHQEKMLIFPFLGLSLFFIGGGVFLAYEVTLPIANQYLTAFNQTIGQNSWTLGHYVDYVLMLCLGHAVAAELALLLLILVHFRVLSPEWLMDKRRYFIVSAFILGALLTPPDVLTQLLLAFPLIGFYEIAILYAKWRKPISTEDGNSNCSTIS